MVEMKRQSLMMYLYVAMKTGAKYLSWDAITGITTRGTHGALAQAVTYLAKRKDLFDEFVQWAEDLKERTLLPAYEQGIPVSPYTSQTCGDCFSLTGVQNRTRVSGIPYDEFQCKECGMVSNRHSNAARVSAILLRIIFFNSS